MSLFKKCVQKIREHAENASNPYVVFGIFGVITYPLYYFIWKYFDAQGYENIYLRLIATLLCLGLIFKDHWPIRLQKFLPFYWYWTLLYCLPFLFTFFLLKNNFSESWALNAMTVLVLSILLMDIISLLIILPLGIILGWLCFVLTTHSVNFPSNYPIIIATYFSVFLFGVIFAHNKEIIKNEKLRAIGTLSESIAHELRTPLRTITSGVNGIRKYLPDLITSYQRARQAKLNIPYISAIHYESLQTACDDIESEARSAFTVIDMLLVKVNYLSENPNENRICSIQRCVDEALRRYPFDSEDAALIEWREGDDFLFKGSELLVIHVLFNLFKNSLYYIKAGRKGKIKIWTEFSDKCNILHFKDTATGISPKNLPHVFERFYSKTLHGTGIGLAFCKLVMQGLGGDIHCESIEGKFTEFKLSFPKPTTFTNQKINDASLGLM